MPSVNVPTTAMLAWDDGNDLLSGSGICSGWVGSATGGRARPTKCLMTKPVISTSVTGTATYRAFHNGCGAPNSHGSRQSAYQRMP